MALQPKSARLHFPLTRPSRKARLFGEEEKFQPSNVNPRALVVLGSTNMAIFEFYGLKHEPFGVTPDPRYLFPTATHREALASLRYGIEAGRGFLTLIARPGMGKTTLLFRLIENLRGSARTVFLFQTVCNPVDLMRYLFQDLGIDTPGHDMVRMHRELNQILLREASAGRRFVLIIDEAQNLSEPVLETARLLSNFETPTSKLIQIILAGQPELAGKLGRKSLSQLRQRISIFSRLEPFSPAETFAYIHHRLGVAGHDGFPLFTRAALDLIAEHSEGIPRNINSLCSNSLCLGFALDQTLIGADIVREVIADLCVSSPAPKASWTAPVPEPEPPPYAVPPAEPRVREIPFANPIHLSLSSLAPKAPPAASVSEPEPPPYAVLPAEPRAREIPFASPIHLSVSSPAPEAPAAAPVPEPEPAALTVPPAHAPEALFGKGIRPVSSPAPNAPPAAPVPEPEPAALTVPPAEPPAREIPLLERIHWPRSSLILEALSAAPAPEPEPAALTLPPAEPRAREIPLANRAYLPVSSPAPKGPPVAPAHKPEPPSYAVPPAEPLVPATVSERQWFLPKSAWVLVVLTFALTLYVSTKFWIAQSGEISSGNSAILASTKPTETSASMEPVVHVVRQNETIERIARSYFGYSDPALLAEISKLNPDMNPKQLKIGQRILLPKKNPAPAPAIPGAPAQDQQDKPHE